MISEEIAKCVLQQFDHIPTADQAEAMCVFARFRANCMYDNAMILRGSAGTGKTSLASAIVRALRVLKQEVVLLAPTGRAAKVFALNAGQAAYTIHRHIYRQKAFRGENTMFTLAPNLHKNAIIIVDEASMLSDKRSLGNTFFGSGNLLDDLIRYVYSGFHNRLLLIGDVAQLPPVESATSPGLQPEVLQGYGLDVYVASLGEVLRQSQSSGILHNATMIRRMIEREETSLLPPLELRAFADICNVSGVDLIDQLGSSYSEVGTDETVVITRSNKRANIYNDGIRARVLFHEEELSSGDMMMIVRNNYHWVQPSTEDGKETLMPYIANGDRALVLRINRERNLYGLRFANALLRFPDYDNLEIEATILLDSIHEDAPSLPREKREKLYNALLLDYQDEKLLQDRIRKIREDEYYNALELKYAYAVTCHKAQGGQWAHVYVDKGYLTDDMVTPDFYRWLYTAFTRAKDRLYLVNWLTERQ